MNLVAGSVFIMDRNKFFVVAISRLYTFILFLFVLLTANKINAQRYFTPDKYYIEAGGLLGVANTFKDYNTNTAGISNLLLPEGMYASLTVSNQRYIAKINGTFFSGKHGNAALYQSSLLVGLNFSQKKFVWNICAGIGLYYVNSLDDSGNFDNIHKFYLPGFTLEYNVYYIPLKFMAVSPFLLVGITPKSYNLSFGLKLALGKLQSEY